MQGALLASLDHEASLLAVVEIPLLLPPHLGNGSPKRQRRLSGAGLGSGGAGRCGNPRTAHAGPRASTVLNTPARDAGSGR